MCVQSNAEHKCVRYKADCNYVCNPMLPVYVCNAASICVQSNAEHKCVRYMAMCAIQCCQYMRAIQC